MMKKKNMRRRKRRKRRIRRGGKDEEEGEEEEDKRRRRKKRRGRRREEEEEDNSDTNGTVDFVFYVDKIGRLLKRVATEFILLTIYPSYAPFRSSKSKHNRGFHTYLQTLVFCSVST